jgi:2-polyprenyl-3-methyl-5-hydroxy-6-metoxy-1,4-benzoquinol methylase
MIRRSARHAPWRLRALKYLGRSAANVARPPRETLIAQHARGHSFLDVGCMWSVDGALCFAAEDAGATAVTGIDVMGETLAFQAERERRASKVRFVQGDLHDPATVAAAGPHDVVWCSGVIYHAPHPMLTLERLRELTDSTLLLATETIPEIRRRPRATVFAPAPGANPAHSEPFDPARGYVNWWWGLTPSAVLAMVEAAGFAVREQFRTEWHLTVVGTRR